MPILVILAILAGFSLFFGSIYTNSCTYVSVGFKVDLRLIEGKVWVRKKRPDLSFHFNSILA
jgi:hypothetical protein